MYTVQCRKRFWERVNAIFIVQCRKRCRQCVEAMFTVQCRMHLSARMCCALCSVGCAGTLSSYSAEEVQNVLLVGMDVKVTSYSLDPPGEYSGFSFWFSFWCSFLLTGGWKCGQTYPEANKTQARAEMRRLSQL
eukprot:1010178-Pelagomonas_calceolata.AAC.1